MRTKLLLPVAVVVAALLFAGCGSSGSDSGSDGSSDKSTTTTPAGSDGGATTTPSGEKVEIPDGYPKAFTPPDGATVTEATAIGTDGSSFVVKATVDDAEAAYNAFKTQVEDAGYEILGPQFTASDQGGYGGFSARGDDYTAAVTFGPDPTGSFSTVTINLAPA